MADRIEIPGIKNQVYALFLSFNVNFIYGHESICKENKEKARIYNENLRDYEPDIVQEAIKKAVKVSPNKMPLIAEIKKQCDRIVRENNKIEIDNKKEKIVNNEKQTRMIFDQEQGKYVIV